MTVADDLARFRAGPCLVAEGDGVGHELLDGLAANAFRWRPVVIATHPDEALGFGHRVQPFKLATRQAHRAAIVVE